MKTLGRITLTAGLALGLIATALPATAASTPSEPLTETPNLIAYTSDPAADAVAKLNSLVGTQSAAEIQEIVTSGRQIETLVNDDNVTIAAFYVEPTFSTMAISERGPGCAVGDACATTTSNTPFGWYGTGQKDINVSNVKRIAAGYYTTTFFRGGQGDFVARNQTTNFTSPRNYNGIARS